MHRKIFAYQIIMLLLPAFLYSQYIEDRGFASRLLGMGSLVFILDDTETAHNLFAFEGNPVDLLDYCQYNRSLEFADRVYWCRHYYGEMPNYYSSPGIRYLQRFDNTFALGFIVTSRLIPHARSVGISSKYRYQILSNLKTGRVNWALASKFNLRPNDRYYDMQKFPNILLALGNTRFGVGCKWRAWRLYTHDIWQMDMMDSDFEIPVYFLAKLFPLELLLLYRYYSNREDCYFFFGRTLWAYDIENRTVFTKCFENGKWRTGLKLNYRRSYGFELYTNSPSTLMNIIPGISMETRKIVFGLEYLFVQPASYDELFFGPRIGIELRRIRQFAIRLGIARIDEHYSDAWPEVNQYSFNLKPFFVAGKGRGTYYSCFVNYKTINGFNFDYGVIITHLPTEQTSFLPTISFQWLF